MDKTVTESEKLRLSLNVRKTCCMVISKKKETPKCYLLVNGQAIRQVIQFSYLGSILTSDGRCDTEIERRIGATNKAFKDLANILTNRSINLDTRKRILNSYVWPILLHGCETWTMSKNIEKKLKSLDLWFPGVC